MRVCRSLDFYGGWSTRGTRLWPQAREELKKLKQNYNAAVASGKTKFDNLFGEAQTVIASVAFQYGSNLKSATPTFWTQVTAQDWDKAIATLKKFGDSYPTRRKLEAGLLEKGWTREQKKRRLSNSPYPPAILAARGRGEGRVREKENSSLLLGEP